MKGKTSIAEDLVFPSKAGTVLDQSNLTNYQFLPCLERAGLRRFRFHDLRHTFGSLLIQDGASLAYAKDQMGHSSIQVTVEILMGISFQERTSRGWTGWVAKQVRNKMHSPRNLRI